VLLIKALSQRKMKGEKAPNLALGTCRLPGSLICFK
jgi:hypothetical protein